MKYTIALLSAAAVLSAAQPHGHAHHRAHQKRDLDSYGGKDDYVVQGPTVIAYVLNGKEISEQEVQEGIRNGSLVWAPSGDISSKGSSTSDASTEAAPSYVAPAPYVAPSDSSTSSGTSSAENMSSPAPVYTPASSPASSYYAPLSSSSSAPSSYSTPSSSSSSSGSGSSSSSGSGVNTPFPDGEIPCSHFPSDYGAVAVDWLGLGGWTGVQNCEGETSAGFTDIVTATQGGCVENAYCSYSCQAGYQKSQWPKFQGKDGQSVGGVVCKNGTLHKTNTDFDTLCIPGASEVTILVKNSMSENVAVCRTDYPGTEAETVPLNVEGGATENLTCPDASTYYTWEGGHTSAQYYVNPKGVSVSDACQWGSSANPWGNWAPLNLGVGYSANAAWLAIFQNSPTTSAKLDFTVTVTGDGVSGSCKYSNGQYCSDSGCSSTTGCTVSLTSGTATFEFTDS
ncbi:SUN-domain-containing protein [Teratosphaeria nubilosa]|uniref:SUN-domain-containing protein n=1 Tax=Teratosphaeria nubilosa TaxID=161662 RepID=A0A6G1LP69_9PEZI|nr:SUN-domain-containing protein [Teratosphaeria nubilosa]